MNNSNGSLNQKILSKTFPISGINALTEYLILFGLGAFAIILHVKLRIPLKLPGHHGLEFMALIMLGRIYSDKPIASTISSLGVACMMFFPIWGGKDPFAGAVYMIPGFALDYLYFTVKSKRLAFLVAIIGGISYALIPVARIIISAVTGFPYSSLLTGVLYPIFSFMFWGAFGSSIALSIKYFSDKRKAAKLQ